MRSSFPRPGRVEPAHGDDRAAWFPAGDLEAFDASRRSDPEQRAHPVPDRGGLDRLPHARVPRQAASQAPGLKGASLANTTTSTLATTTMSASSGALGTAALNGPTHPPSHRMPGPRRPSTSDLGPRPAGHHGVGSGSAFGQQSTTDEWGHMSSKRQRRAIEKSSSTQKELEKNLFSLRAQLTRTEKALTKAKNRADRWRKEAKAQKRSASRARARVEKLHRKLDGASAALEPITAAAAPMAMMASGQRMAEPTTLDGVTMPDETWSVVKLRAEARARGLTGMSNKLKAQLLAALS